MEQIRVDMTPKGIKPVCHSSQYDKGRIIRLNLVDGIQGYTLTGEETLELEVRKPDNNIVTAEVQNTSSNYVLIVTTEQMTACEGDSNCEIRVRLGDTDIGSINFILRVEEDPLKDGIESETEIHNLHTQIEEINAEILPGMVAEEVTRQYDSENVIFDDVPTENHGDGYTVNSAGLKSYIPKIISALDDVFINNPQPNQALVFDFTDPDNPVITNGEVSTVGGLNDLNDVTLENVADKQELVYDDTEDVFKNKTTRVELTQAEYDALENPEPDVDYYITDAPSMQGSSADLSYDGTTLSTYDKIEEVASDVNSVITAIGNIGGAYSLTMPQPITTTSTTYDTYNSRKFSDYDLIIFKMGASENDIRQTVVLPQTVWSSGKAINMGALHGASVSSVTSYSYSSINIQYYSDTKYTAIASGSATLNNLIIWGVKLKTTV